MHSLEKRLLGALFLFFPLVLLQGCLDQNAGVSDTASLSAVVVDETGAPVEGARIALADGGLLATTDETGEAAVTLDTADVPEALLIRSEGHATQVVRIVPGREEYRLEVTLRRRNPPVTVADAAAGFSLEAEDGARLEIPANALAYLDASGNPVDVTGAVQVSITPVDPARDGSGGFPGSFSGIDMSTGRSTPIMSYGTVEYHLALPDGTPVNLKPGATAWIEIPVFAATHPDGTAIQVGDAGQAAWYLDEETGIWQQESDSGVIVASSASPTGMAMRVEVGHFSWWNYDIAVSTCYQSLRITGAPAGASFRIEGRTWRKGVRGMPVYGILELGNLDAVTLLLPISVPTELEAIATTADGVWAGRIVVSACMAGEREIRVSRSGPRFLRASARSLPVFDAANNVTGTEFLAVWTVAGAESLTLRVAETGQVFDVTGLDRFLFTEATIGPAARTLVLEASNAWGTDSRSIVRTLYGAAAAPEIVTWDVVDNGAGRWLLTWEVRGADSVEWAWDTTASGNYTILGRSSSAIGQALLPAGQNDFGIRLRAINRYGQDQMIRMIGSYGRCDPITETCGAF